MKKIFCVKKSFLIVLTSLSFLVVADGIYLWEYNRNGDRACCLSFSGADICNPQTPCTRNTSNDLVGINDYITRLLGLEKSSSLSYATILNQAQYYIRHVLSSSMIQLSYRYDEQRNVKFFHEMIDTLKPNEKTTKIAAAPSTSSTTVTVGAKKDDVVFQYLVKLGLAREWNKR